MCTCGLKDWCKVIPRYVYNLLETFEFVFIVCNNYCQDAITWLELYCTVQIYIYTFSGLFLMSELEADSEVIVF